MPETQLIITDKHMQLLRHTLGNNEFPRNHFVTHEGTPVFPFLCDLVQADLMSVCPPASGWPGAQHIFYATDKGKRVAFSKEAEA